MPFLHLPVQSGSDRMLAAMNRKHTADDYRRIVGQAARRPGPTWRLSSDFIVGFPGETEADFEATMTLVRDIGFAQAYQLQIHAAAGHARRAAPASGARKPRRTVACRPCRRCCASSRPTFNAACVGLDLPVLFTGPAATLAKSPAVHHFFIRFTYREVQSYRYRIDGANRRQPSKLTCGNPCPGETNSLTHLAAPQAPPAAASGKTMASPATSGGKATTLQFNDNTLLPLLLGDHDRHLVRIEQALGVRLSCRGNRVAIAGEASRVDVAQEMLRGLWRRLERGESVGRAKSRRRSGWPTRKTIRGCRCRTCRRSAPAAARSVRAVRARPPTWKRWRTMRWCSASVRPAPARPISPSPRPWRCCRPARWTASCCRRPAVEAGERLGFLPGDMKEKIDPYLRPLYDALHDMMPADQVIRRMTNGEIEVAPLAFMRGRTLAHCYAILDEAQNTTPMQMKMFLTRMGEGTRMVITGDLSQVDLPNGVRSGLRDALDTVEGIQGIGVVRFEQRDVVRHPLVARSSARMISGKPPRKARCGGSGNDRNTTSKEQSRRKLGRIGWRPG